MSAENMSSYEAMNADVDSAVRKSLRKPIAAFAVGAALVVGGLIDHAAEQPEADALTTQIDARLNDLDPSEAAVISDYLQGEDLPEGAEPSLVKTAKSIGELSDEQRHKDDAGSGFIVSGFMLGLLSGVKILIRKIEGSQIKERLKEVHPDLAPKRLDRDSKRLFELGYSVETSDQFARQHRDWPNLSGPWDRYGRHELQTIGRDIESSGEFTQEQPRIEQELTEYLNNAQWGALLDSRYDTAEEVREADDFELYRIGLIDDLWQPKDTFTSLTDWYVYRRRQVVKPHTINKIKSDDLFLPELEARPGGIGIALSRVAYYVRLMEISGADREAKGEAMVFATEGARILDEIAPRTDSTHWFDHIQKMERNTFTSVI